MQEIKTTLAELDALREKATQGEWVGIEFHECHGCDSVEIHVDDSSTHNVLDSSDYIVALHNAYPTLRAHIERLERIEAAYVECGGQLTEQGEPKLTHLTRVAEAGRVLAEAVEKMGPRHVFSAGGWPSEDDEHYRELRNAALSAYRTAVQDLTSKE